MAQSSTCLHAVVIATFV